MRVTAETDGRRPIALTIAGSDTGAGAGIQADLKTFAAHGAYGVTVLTMVTAQSTSSVDEVHPLPPRLIERQLQTVLDDFHVRAVKTGALGTADIIATVAWMLQERGLGNIVIDPVMISKHGHSLLDEDAVAALVEELLPLATVLTPNLHEAAELTGLEPGVDRDWMRRAAGRLIELGCKAVVLKGGHRETDAADLLATAAGEEHWLEGERVDTAHTHGTGCTFSAAIAANLLHGQSLLEACRAAKHYVAGAMRSSPLVGRGINPLDHFWQLADLLPNRGGL
jgi:hydroxymethylpyrimidine/phosphomethylpyrimidine kinase